jgi:hypothetical protein
MPSRDQIEARREQQARERGKALPHFTRKVAQELSARPKRGKLTPSKRG